MSVYYTKAKTQANKIDDCIDDLNSIKTLLSNAVNTLSNSVDILATKATEAINKKSTEIDYCIKKLKNLKKDILSVASDLDRELEATKVNNIQMETKRCG